MHWKCFHNKKKLDKIKFFINKEDSHFAYQFIAILLVQRVQLLYILIYLKEFQAYVRTVRTFYELKSLQLML